MKIMNIREMPKFNPEVKNGIDSVSTGKVVMHPTFHPDGGMSWDDIGPMKPHPACAVHGCMNKVSTDGIWRCLACGVGCYAATEESPENPMVPATQVSQPNPAKRDTSEHS